MASTLQIKRGTGSAVPSGLSDGELAINLDNNKLYFGSGSVSKNYFNLENITSSGHISCSGTVYANSVLVTPNNPALTVDAGGTNLQLGNASYFRDYTYGRETTHRHNFIGEITSSGNISSSGNVIASEIYADKIRRQTDSGTTTKILLNDEVIKFNAGHSSNETLKLEQDVASITGNITASGDISSSGDIHAANIFAGSHGHQTRIKILPTEFRSDGGPGILVGRSTVYPEFVRVQESGGVVEGGSGTTTEKMYWLGHVPQGYKAVAGKIYGNATSATHGWWSGSIQDSGVVALCTSNTTATNTEKTFDIAMEANDDNYIICYYNRAGFTNEVHGGYVTIEKI